MISVFTKNTKERKSNIELVLNSIRDIFPKEKINICDNDSELLTYISELQESHFKKYRFANTKTNILFSIHSFSQMMFEVIDKFPNEDNYWFINDKHLVKKAIDDINASENKDIISLYNANGNYTLDVIRIPKEVAVKIKELVEEEKDKAKQLHQLFDYGIFDDTYYSNCLHRISTFMTLGISFYSDNRENDYFEYIG